MDFELRFTDKEITAWGGMGLLKRMLDHMQFDTALSFVQACPNPALTGATQPNHSPPNSCSRYGVVPIALGMAK